MKIEMPKEPDVDRLWSLDPETREVIEWRRIAGGWQQAKKPGGNWAWPTVVGTRGPLYTTHPDFEVLEKYPAPWSTRASGGTVRAKSGTVVLDPTLQCPPCLTALIVRAVNELAERNAAVSSPQTEDEKK